MCKYSSHFVTENVIALIPPLDGQPAREIIVPPEELKGIPDLRPSSCLDLSQQYVDIALRLSYTHPMQTP
jgi:hypothetical protein